MVAVSAKTANPVGQKAAWTRHDARGSLHRSKVAVLDDDRDTATSIADLLTRQGFLASAYSNAQSLETAAGRDGFVAFVLDWMLGEGTAAGLIVKLRADPALARAPIFLLSGNLAVSGVPHDPDLVSAIRDYQLHFRSKPYSSVLLAKELASALAQTFRS